MAGHRRTRKPGTPTTRERHHDNSQGMLLDRLADTADPLERLTHSYDYLRSAVRRAKRRGTYDVIALDKAVRILISTADAVIR